MAKNTDRDLPANWDTSNEPRAIEYRVALARSSNAIEGVILTNDDKAFMDKIPADLPMEKFGSLVKQHLKAG